MKKLIQFEQYLKKVAGTLSGKKVNSPQPPEMKEDELEMQYRCLLKASRNYYIHSTKQPLSDRAKEIYEAADSNRKEKAIKISDLFEHYVPLLVAYHANRKALCQVDSLIRERNAAMAIDTVGSVLKQYSIIGNTEIDAQLNGLMPDAEDYQSPLPSKVSAGCSI